MSQCGGDYVNKKIKCTVGFWIGGGSEKEH